MFLVELLPTSPSFVSYASFFGAQTGLHDYRTRRFIAQYEMK